MSKNTVGFMVIFFLGNGRHPKKMMPTTEDIIAFEDKEFIDFWLALSPNLSTNHSQGLMQLHYE